MLTSPYVVLVINAAILGGTAVIGRASVDEVPPFQMSFWRWALAAAVLIPLGWSNLRTQRSVFFAHWKLLTVMSLLGAVTYSSLLFWALRYTTAINVVLIMAMVPVVVLFLTWLMGKARVSRIQLAGFFISLAGTVVIITRADIAVLTGLQLNFGDLLNIIGVFSWSLYSVLMTRLPREITPYGMIATLSMIGAVCLFPFFVAEIAVKGMMHVSFESLIQIAYVGIGTSVISYVMWSWALGRIGPNKSSPYLYLPVLFGAVFAMIFLGETLHMFHLWGTVLIFSGIFLSTSRRIAARSGAIAGD